MKPELAVDLLINHADFGGQGYRGMVNRKLVVINATRLSLFINWLVPVLPRRLVLKAIARVQKKPGD